MEADQALRTLFRPRHLSGDELDLCEQEADCTSEDGTDREPWSRHFARAVERAFCDANGLPEPEPR